MSQTAYVRDLLAITKHGYCHVLDYADRLEKGETHPDECEFDQLSSDIQERFGYTIGAHRGLVAIIDALPPTKNKSVIAIAEKVRNLYRRAIADFEFLDDRFSDYSLRPGLKANRFRSVVMDVQSRAQTCLMARRAVLAAIDKIKDDRGDASVSILKLAVRPVIERTAKDYELLAGLFADFAAIANGTQGVCAKPATWSPAGLALAA